MRLSLFFLLLFLSLTSYAIENIKVNGDVQFYYSSEERSTQGESTPNIFDKDATNADLGLNLGLSADLSEGVSSGISVTAVSNLALENVLASGVSSSAHKTNAQGSSFDDALWISEAWIAGSINKSTLKLGRQALANPLIYTETWSMDYNTFEAAVFINEDLPQTSFVLAWIGKSNATADDEHIDPANSTNTQGLANGALVAQDGKFNTFSTNGAYMAGLLNHTLEPLHLQAWYYDLQSFARAYWIQADFEREGLLAGAQYTHIKTEAGSDADTAYGLMLGYANAELFTLNLAYSKVDDKGDIGVANLATGATTAQGRNGSGAESKLYTEMWWNYGAVSQTGAQAYSIALEKTAYETDFFIAYYYSDIAPDGNNNDLEVKELTLSAYKEFGPLSSELVLIFDDYSYEKSSPEADTKATTFQVTLTYNF